MAAAWPKRALKPYRFALQTYLIQVHLGFGLFCFVFYVRSAGFLAMLPGWSWQSAKCVLAVVDVGSYFCSYEMLKFSTSPGSQGLGLSETPGTSGGTFPVTCRRVSCHQTQVVLMFPGTRDHFHLQIKPCCKCTQLWYEALVLLSYHLSLNCGYFSIYPGSCFLRGGQSL